MGSNNAQRKSVSNFGKPAAHIVAKPLLTPGLRPPTQAELHRLAQIKAQRIKALRAGMTKVSEKAHIPRKAFGLTNEALFKGRIGTRDSVWKLKDLKKISAMKRNPNSIIARKVFAVYSYTLANRRDLISEDHQALVNVATKTVKAFYGQRTVVLTQRERKVLTYFYRKAAQEIRVG